ncbi:unnamed protein product [Phaedon cochleariae]|uniref:cGMP-dependent protein kinase interacting domain-containing protein n=1 Tax=Phaedon cochleariae TaxID=80249 RepID=A0A9N9SLC9_PHACE|nr:unnamed protein product [Phaedon cochleariae]
MVEFLVDHGADVNRGDNEGWTPLHATASCGFLSIAKYLIERGGDVAAVNNDGELALDIAECGRMEENNMFLGHLETVVYPWIFLLGIDCEAARNEEEMIMLRDAKGWLASNSPSVNLPHPKNGATPLHELKKKQNKEEVFNRRMAKKRPDVGDRNLESETPNKVKKVERASEKEPKISENTETQNKLNSPIVEKNNTTPIISQKIVDDLEDWRKSKENSDLSSPTKSISDSTNFTKPPDVNEDNDVTIRRKPSLQSDKVTSKAEGSEEATAPALAAPPSRPSPDKARPATSPPPPNSPPPTSVDLSRNERFRDSFNYSSAVSRSFVPPVRDEESETQRKAHAKRVRETRRSTQGVTLEEIKSAEQLVKKKNQSNSDNNNETANEAGSNGQSPNGVVVTATITTGTPTVITRETEEPPAIQERRPSWRLRVDNGSSKQADGRPTSKHAELRAADDDGRPDQDKENDIRNAQATLATQAAIQRRRRPKRRSTGVVSFENIDDPDQEKDPTDGKDCDDATKMNHIEVLTNNELDILSSSYNTRPKSLGHYPSYSSSACGPYSSTTNPYSSATSSPYSSATSTSPYSSFGNYNGYGSNYQSPYFQNGYRGNANAGGYASLKIPAKALLGLAGTKKYDADAARGDLSRGGSYRERSVSRSRNSLASGDRSSRSRIGSTSDIRNENGEIDYKKLYEKQLVENDRLKDKLRKSDEELRETKQTLEKISLVTSKNSLSELEKRERRAMERKLSEMEEELKNLENLKSENQRLKDENGALIRVISKLSK